MKTLLTILACVGFAISCDKTSTPVAPAGSANSNEKIVLQLNWKAEPEFGGFYNADLIGAFAGQHLNVEVREGGASIPTIDLVAAGKVPFAVVSGDELIVARSKGKKVVAVFAVYQTHPQGILTRSSRGLKELADIFKNEGTIALEKGLPYVDFLKNKYGFDKVKVVPLAAADLNTLKTDEKLAIQCYVTSEPLTAKRQGIEAATFLIADSGYNPYATVLAVNEEYLSTNRATVESVVQAVADGWQSYLNDPSSANAAMSKINTTMDPQTFSQSAELQKPLIQTDETTKNGIGSMTRERWQTLGQQLVELKVIDKAPNAEECFVQLLKTGK